MLNNSKYIRNFSIIAHIDHGKSTLADRLIELTNTVTKLNITNQYLDSLELERKRGITIKLNYIQLQYEAKDGHTYYLNMVDTPGHVDFTYEVSRSLAACEGALLVVDASQGIQAQTLSNVDLALENDLIILPVINKIDLPHANVEKTRKEIKNIIGLTEEHMSIISAKNNINIIDVLENIVNFLPPPPNRNLTDDNLRCLIFDSYYDNFQGVLIYIKVVSGNLYKDDNIYFYHGGIGHRVKDIFIKKDKLTSVNELCTGNIGIISCSIKKLSEIKIGDTITHAATKNITPLPNYHKVIQVVFSSFYPITGGDYEHLEKALKKIKLTDDSLIFEPENSSTLGHGFRCGFLGGLHLEVIRERIEIEYKLDVIVAFPSVKYWVFLTNGKKLVIDNPSKLPEKSHIQSIEEPYCKLLVVTPITYYGKILEYSIKKRAVFIKNDILESDLQLVIFHIPLAELIIDYFDVIKSISKGYASIDYQFLKYQESKLIRLDIKLNNEIIEPLTSISPIENAYYRGKWICKNIKQLLPKHSFEIPVQATIGNKVIARETVKATRKDVTAKLYGGDVSRKKKLLEKQKAGKKRMKRFGKVNVPQDLFVKLVKMND